MHVGLQFNLEVISEGFTGQLNYRILLESSFLEHIVKYNVPFVCLRGVIVDYEGHPINGGTCSF